MADRNLRSSDAAPARIDPRTKVEDELKGYTTDQLKALAKDHHKHGDNPNRMSSTKRDDLVRDLVEAELSPVDEWLSSPEEGLQVYGWPLDGSSFNTYEPVTPQPQPIDSSQDLPVPSIQTSTPLKSTVRSEAYRDKREQDREWCAALLPGRLYATQVESMVWRLFGGTEAFKERAGVAQSGLSAEAPSLVKDFVRREKNGDDSCEKDGQYWLKWLADQSGTGSDELGKWKFQRGPKFVMNPGERAKGDRKLDAAIIPSDAVYNQWSNTLVPIEFTATRLAANVVRSVVGSGDEAKKVQQLVLNLVDVMMEQPERRFVFGISFHDVDAVLCILDHEGLAIARLDGVGVASTPPAPMKPRSKSKAPSDSPTPRPRPLAELSAILHLALNSSIYEIGLNPLVQYGVGRILRPRALHLISEWTLDPELLSPTDRNPFSKATTVRKVRKVEPLDSQHKTDDVYFVKFADVDDQRAGKETGAYSFLSQSLTPYPCYLPELICNRILPRSPTKQLSSKALSTPYAGASSAIQSNPRHLEVIIIKTTHQSVPISEVHDPTVVIQVFHQLVKAIGELGQLGYSNGDLSSTNIRCKVEKDSDELASSSPLLWIDHESATYPGQPKSLTDRRSATLDVMAVADLASMEIKKRPFRPGPLNDLESATYLLLKTLSTAIITPSFTSSSLSSSTEEIREAMLKMSWNKIQEPSYLSAIRQGFWGCHAGATPFQDHCQAVLEAIGESCEALKELLYELSMLPLGKHYPSEKEREEWPDIQKAMLEALSKAMKASIPHQWP